MPKWVVHLENPCMPVYSGIKEYWRNLLHHPSFFLLSLIRPCNDAIFRTTLVRRTIGPMIYISHSTDITLAALAQMPFLDSAELAAVAGLPDRTAREAVKRLDGHGLIGSVTYTAFDGIRVRRWYLKLEGIEELARSRLEGETADDLIANNDMLSAQGRRHLLERLDAVGVIYRVARAVASKVEDAQGLRFRWRWETQGVLDAVLQLPDGRTVAISRIGSTQTGKATRGRLSKIRDMHTGEADEGRLHTTLLLVPGVVEREGAAVLMRSGEVEGVHVAVETEMMRAAIDAPVWHTLDGRRVAAGEAFANAPPSGMPPTRRWEREITPPSEDIAADAGELGLAATKLSAAARTLLRLLYDLQFIRVSQLRLLTGLSEGHLNRVKAELKKAGLVHYVSVGRTVNGRKKNGRRVALSEKGITYLQLVDRSSETFIRRFWLLEPCEKGEEKSPKHYHVPGIRVVGSKGHGLLKERLHTDGVYAFASLLLYSCGRRSPWEVLQALPAHRWERHYVHGRRYHQQFKDDWRSIRPDFTFALSHPDRPFASFVLEFERTAKHRSTIKGKVEKYKNYFAAAVTRSDFADGRPTVLFVYETRDLAANFARYAHLGSPQALPMLVSSLEDLEKAGSVFSYSWRFPWNLDAGDVWFQPMTPA